MRARALFRAGVAVSSAATLIALAMLAAGSASSGCNSPASTIDGGDLMGVFDRDGGRAGSGIVAIDTPSASTVASTVTTARHHPKKDAGAPIEPSTRKPDGPSCVALEGAPADPPSRTMGRPACRSADVLEWRDPDGAPRYACLVVPPDADKKGPLPLVVFLHGDTPGLDDPATLGKLTDLRDAGAKFDLGEGPGHEGFVLLAVQGRAIGHGKLGGASFDTAFTGPDNVDRVTIDHFVDEIIARGGIDSRRIYAVGSGRGGQMAATYAMLRADRVAAFGVYAAPRPTADWACPGPPPPGIVLYRACDDVAACDDVETWLLDRDKARADTMAIRLGEVYETVPNCAVDQCSKKHGEANHARWPKGREKDLLRYLAAHSLAAE
jgi:hypothetical protein